MADLATLETEIAVRAYVATDRAQRRRPTPPRPSLVLVLDCETTTDHAQALLFGSFRVYEASGRLRQEGLIAADDLPEDAFATLAQYVKDHAADNGGHLRLWRRFDFANILLWPIAYRSRALVVGFNLPFDLSRLAVGWRPAKNGGFSLQVFEYNDADGLRHRNSYRPEITVKSLGSKRNFISFTGMRKETAAEHRKSGSWWQGRFLDLHTLTYAFTDRSLSLDAAAREFGLAVNKDKVERHGVVTAEYVDYNRQDVRVTWELYRALVAEFERHPIDLAPEQAFSPAAISKAYLRAAGVTPPIERSSVSVDRLGQAMAAYYGGRAECRIRGVPLPVRYVDFASMYPTVFALEGLWSWVVADRLDAVDATVDAREILATVTRTDLHDPAIWRSLAGVFCRVRPTGALLPVRARYGAGRTEAGDPIGSLAWTIGLNELESDHDLWITLADLVAAKLLGTTASVILEAFRIVPSGQLDSLRPVNLRGAIPVDPARDDLFRFATEERARVRRDQRRSPVERERLGQFLKTFANGGAYGIFAEVRQLAPVSGGEVVMAYGLSPLEARVSTPEEPGAFCYPPLAATITGGARLLLALLQADVEAAGGTYLACDTDSLLIVASESGGLHACPGGGELLPDGRAAVRTLGWADVDTIVAGFDRLNPYARGTVKSLIKLERENFARDDETQPEELTGLALSAKRYVLYQRDGQEVHLRKASEHGLGLYRAPLERPKDWGPGWPAWVDAVWRDILARAEGRSDASSPPWYGLPAVSHLPISGPTLLRPFAAFNRDRPFADQVKPFGFMMLGHAAPFAVLPNGMERSGLTPIAPFSTKPDELLALPWLNRYDGRPLRVATGNRAMPDEVRLQTIGEVVADYRLHPETKSGDPRGGLGRRGSIGLLPRLRVRAIGLPIHIGKESNRLEEAQGGLVTDPDEVYVEYRDERRAWEAALPALRRLRDERGWRHLAEASGLSERAIRYALNTGVMPHRTARDALLRLAAG